MLLVLCCISQDANPAFILCDYIYIMIWEGKWGGQEESFFQD